MTPAELIATCAPSSRSNVATILRYLSQQVYEAHLADGQRLRDATDFKQWLEELAKEAER